MRRVIDWEIVIALCVILAATEAAEARYNPHQGRWTTRDPLGVAMSSEGMTEEYPQLVFGKSTPSVAPLRGADSEYGTSRHTRGTTVKAAFTGASLQGQSTQKVDVNPRMGVLRANVAWRRARTGSTDVAELPEVFAVSPFRQYGDGPNLYGYASARPTAATDPTGLDRYIMRQWPHYGIAVDVWRWDSRRNCWVVRGQKRFDFSVDYHSPAWPLGIVVFGGLVREQDGIGDGHKQKLTSACSEDRALLQSLMDQMANPPLYSLPLYNCYHWTMEHIGDGMDPSAIKRDCDCNCGRPGIGGSW